tara:strand:+ start:632 stop:1945 length:1314 start_codon:yes stop_codon:yes gene_type:complete
MTNKGQKLWIKAKQLIPGGNMLLSKRSEMFLPDIWPSYFSKAKGCTVWDLDGKEYIDMSIMGIGTNTLGYGKEEIDEVVREVISQGNMSTLNCPEEVYLSEKLLKLHPWADNVRLARTGGEANSIAIRIARAAASRKSEKVAICGYHGWHDWYLAANLKSDSELGEHLLPGLSPKGVPKDLLGSVYPFNYNDYENLEELVNREKIGIIKMEVSRSVGPKDNFLVKVRKLADENDIILIFDECTSGFRQTNGGLHKVYNVTPDIAVFGKAMGNGYAITAVIGKKEFMQAAQDSFISSTFWTERIGPAAALKTIEVMEQIKSWDVISKQGDFLRFGLLRLAEKYDLSLNCGGISAIQSMSFNSKNNLIYKTYLTQEMLKKGYLASTLTYMCINHTDKVITDYLNNLDPIFKDIKEFEEGRDISTILDGPVCHSGFNRLN